MQVNSTDSRGFGELAVHVSPPSRTGPRGRTPFSCQSPARPLHTRFFVCLELRLCGPRREQLVDR